MKYLTIIHKIHSIQTNPNKANKLLIVSWNDYNVAVVIMKIMILISYL